MKIICFNCSWLGRILEASQHEVRRLGTFPDAGQVLSQEECNVEGLIRAAGMQPDVILLELWGNRPFLRGIEERPCPVAAVVLDAPLNAFWLQHYLQAVDLAFVDQHDSSERFAQAQGDPGRVRWLPLAVNKLLLQQPAAEPEHEILFVGRVSEDRLKRSFMLQTLEHQHTVRVVGRPGDPWLKAREMIELFATARIVLNENLFDGLTLRVFQGLASGALVLTEHCENGLAELFTPDVHLATFTPETLLSTLARYLEDEALRRRVAAAGQAELAARHTNQHRAATVLDALAGLERQPPSGELVHLGLGYAYAGIRFDDQWPKLAALAESCLRQGLAAKPPPPLAAEAHLGLARLHAWQAPPRLQEAREHLQRAAALLPHDHRPWLDMGQVRRLQGDAAGCCAAIGTGLDLLERQEAPQRQVEACRRALASGPAPSLWLALGELFLELGQPWERGCSKHRDEELPENAAEYYHLALRQGGGAAAHKGLGRAYMAVGVADQALLHFMAALEETPDDPECNVMAGVASKAVYLPGTGQAYRSRWRSLRKTPPPDIT